MGCCRVRPIKLLQPAHEGKLLPTLKCSLFCDDGRDTRWRGASDESFEAP
jgi:hypothetical protein